MFLDFIAKLTDRVCEGIKLIRLVMDLFLLGGALVIKTTEVFMTAIYVASYSALSTKEVFSRIDISKSLRKTKIKMPTIFYNMFVACATPEPFSWAEIAIRMNITKIKMMAVHVNALIAFST